MLSEKNRYKNILTDIIYLMVIAALVYQCYVLFGQMIVDHKGGPYWSDLPYYFNKAMDPETGNHRLPLVLFKYLYSLTRSPLGIVIYLAADIGLIFIANYFYLKTYSKADTKERLTRIMVQFFSIAAVFAGPIYVPRIHTAFYKNTFPTFAWHSPTQQMMTLFVVLGTMCFFMMLDNYEKKISPGWWLGAAVFYLLSAYTKPSFILDFVPAVVIAFIIELCIKSEISFGEKFKKLFIMGCSLVPSGLYMIFLNYYIYQRAESDGNGDILVTSAKIAEYDHLWVAICCCMAFPLVVMLFNWKRLFRDGKYRIIILAAIMGLLQWGLLGESGRRASHGNFGWGRIIGGYMLMLTSMAILVENVRDKEFLGGKKWLRGLYFLMAAGSLALHLICNVYYFVTICAGGGYWR